jgi:hypothetical protein
MKSLFENAVIEFHNYAQDFELRPSIRLKPRQSDKEANKNKLEKLASIFDKY